LVTVDRALIKVDMEEQGASTAGIYGNGVATRYELPWSEIPVVFARTWANRTEV